MAWRIGADLGGTFTDVCLFGGATGAMVVGKVATGALIQHRDVRTGLINTVVLPGMTGCVERFRTLILESE
jgi:N-methylhydantoinase A/oxoprolinase/acetone carboxylase beta subunit